jgi:hypothetical protein
MSVRLRRLWIQLSSDRRRFAALGVMLFVGLLLWARIIVVSRMPRMAVATEVASAHGSDNSKTGQSPGGDAKSKADREPVVIELAVNPGRDPFVISRQYFPKPTPSPEVTALEGKSGPKAAEDSEQSRIRRVAVLRGAVEGLKLEAAMGGSMALISGKPYRQGDWITVSPARQAGADPIRFQIHDVKQRSVILECEGERFELKMIEK